MEVVEVDLGKEVEEMKIPTTTTKEEESAATTTLLLLPFPSLRPLLEAPPRSARAPWGAPRWGARR